MSEFTVRSTPSLCSAKSHRVSTLHPTLTPRPPGTVRTEYRSAAASPALPKSQRECITHQRIRSSNILSCWMSELRIIIHYQFDEDHPFDLVSGCISRAGVPYWHLIQTRRSVARMRWRFSLSGIITYASDANISSFFFIRLKNDISFISLTLPLLL